MNTRGTVASSLATGLVTLVICTVCSAVAINSATASGPAVDEAAALTITDTASEARGHFKKMMLNPYMLIPQLITLGFAPIVLANLKMMVMSALMINNMALNAAIFMTVRNMVFGPRPKVKYVNHGYSKHHDIHDRQHEQHSTPEEEMQSTAEAGNQLRRRGKRVDVASWQRP